MKLATGIVDRCRGCWWWKETSVPMFPPALIDWRSVVAEGAPALDRVARACKSAARIRTDDVRWCPPISNPRKIFAVGRNYAEHALEQGASLPDEPIIFSKLPTTLIGHQQEVRLSRLSDQVDYEAELVVVIGRGGREICREHALQHVAGYMCGNDITARDWQKHKPGGQWLLGKSFDTFAPTGPYLVTADEVSDPQQLDIRLRLNHQTMQDSHTGRQIFPVDHLIAYLSAVATLEPGDLIFTGTPPGVGFARTPPVFLQPGDVLEVEVAGLGCLRNRVVAPAPAPAAPAP